MYTSSGGFFHVPSICSPPSLLNRTGTRPEPCRCIPGHESALGSPPLERRARGWVKSCTSTKETNNTAQHACQIVVKLNVCHLVWAVAVRQVVLGACGAPVGHTRGLFCPSSFLARTLFDAKPNAAASTNVCRLPGHIDGRLSRTNADYRLHVAPCVVFQGVATRPHVRKCPSTWHHGKPQHATSSTGVC